MKNRIIIITLVYLTTLSNTIICMDEIKPQGPTVLLRTNGEELKKLLAIEAQGTLSRELLAAEKTLERFLKSYPRKTLKESYTKETRTLARLISKRPHHRATLFSVIESGDNPDQLEEIITKNPYVLNAYDRHHTNLLLKAVLLERNNCVKKLLQLNANPNCFDSEGCSLLYKAVKNYLPTDIIDDLLRAGADPNQSNHQKQTPFQLVFELRSPAMEIFENYGYLFFSALWPYQNPVDLLNNNGEYLKELATQPLGSPEWELAETALNKLFKHLDKGNRTFPGNIDIDQYGFSLQNADITDCEYALGKGMITYARNIVEEKLIMKISLFDSIKNKDYQKLNDLLQNCEISAAFQYKLIMYCLKYHNIDCLAICLKHNFSPNRYHKGISPLHYAVEINNPLAITFLTQCNTTDLVPLYINEKNLLHDPQTPLDYAVSLKNQICIQALTKAIKKNYNNLTVYNGHCGLIKHILISGPCEECRINLKKQLTHHGLQDPCNNIADVTGVITDLNS